MGGDRIYCQCRMLESKREKHKEAKGAATIVGILAARGRTRQGENSPKSAGNPANDARSTTSMQQWFVQAELTVPTVACPPVPPHCRASQQWHPNMSNFFPYLRSS